MNLGFIGTGNIVSDVITGIKKSKFSYKKIIISPRNKKKAQYVYPAPHASILVHNVQLLLRRASQQLNERLAVAPRLEGFVANVGLQVRSVTRP